MKALITYNIISDENLLTLIIVTAGLLLICILLLIIVAIRAGVKKKKASKETIEEIVEEVVVSKTTIEEPVSSQIKEVSVPKLETKLDEKVASVANIIVEDISSKVDKAKEVVVETITEKVELKATEFVPETISAKSFTEKVGEKTIEVVSKVEENKIAEIKPEVKVEPIAKVEEKIPEPIAKLEVKPEPVVVEKKEEIKTPEPIVKVNEEIKPILEKELPKVDEKKDKLIDFSAIILGEKKVEETPLPKVEEKPLEVTKEDVKAVVEEPIVKNEEIVAEIKEIPKPIEKEEKVKLIDFSAMILGDKTEVKPEEKEESIINNTFESVEEEIEEIPEPLSEDDYIIESPSEPVEETVINEVISSSINTDVQAVKDLEKENIIEETEEAINAIINEPIEDRNEFIQSIEKEIAQVTSFEEEVLAEGNEVSSEPVVEQKEETIKFVEKVVEVSNPKTFTDWLSSINKK